MVKVMYYQRAQRISEAPEGLRDLTMSFVYVPSLRLVLNVDDSRSLDPTYAGTVGEDDLAEARKVYQGARRSGNLRYRSVKIYEFDGDSLRKLAKNMRSLDRLREEVLNGLEALIRSFR